MTFGEKFKAEREKRNMTQQAVADGLGLNRRMITRYEHNVSFPRSRKAYKKIADFFEIDVNYLLTEDREYTPWSEGEHNSHGMVQAQRLVDKIADLFSNGSLSDMEKETVMKSLQDIYWHSRIHSAEQQSAPKKRGRKKNKSEE